MTLIYINTTYWCGGVVINNRGIVTDCPPVAAWTRGKSIDFVLDFYRRKKCLVEYLPILGEENNS